MNFKMMTIYLFLSYFINIGGGQDKCKQPFAVEMNKFHTKTDLIKAGFF